MGRSSNLVSQEAFAFNTGVALELKKGQSIRVIGRTTVDFVALNLHNLNERFDQARTKTNQAKIFITKGDVLFSKGNNVMMTIVEDTFPGHHDLQKGMCSRKRFEMVFRGESKRELPGGGTQTSKRWEDLPDHGCLENLTEALRPWKVSPDDIPSPFNIFQNMQIDGETGRMLWDHLDLQNDSYVELRAEMDLLVAGSSGPGVGSHPLPHIEVYDG